MSEGSRRLRWYGADLCVRYRRSGVAADVYVRDAGAVRRLAAQQAASQRAGGVPARAGAQGNAERAPAARARVALPRVGAAAPPQLPGRAAVPQLLLSPPLCPYLTISLSLDTCDPHASRLAFVLILLAHDGA